MFRALRHYDPVSNRKHSTLYTEPLSSATGNARGATQLEFLSIMASLDFLVLVGVPAFNP